MVFMDFQSWDSMPAMDFLGLGCVLQLTLHLHSLIILISHYIYLD